MDKNQVRAAQSRRRDFIRSHHPDRGGDPDAFMAGLRSFAENPANPADPDLGPLPLVFIVKRRRWPARLAAAAAHRLRPNDPGAQPQRVH
jgi:hypothetical protein